MALGITVLALWASRNPDEHRWLFDLLAISGALLAIAHLRGLIEGDQPLIEDLEVAAYAGFALTAWLCRPRPAAASAPGQPAV